MIIPKGANHYSFYHAHKYDKEKIVSKYEGVFMLARSGCCMIEVDINWIAAYKGLTVAIKPFTEKGEYEAYLELEAYKATLLQE